MSTVFGPTPEREAIRHVAEIQLVRLALTLGARNAGGPLSPDEARLADRAEDPLNNLACDVDAVRQAIRQGKDPLGEAFLAIRSPAVRRLAGAIYTPPLLVNPMVDWIMQQCPTRVIDAGAGSGRFALEVARRSQDIEVVAVDLDPLATLLIRAAVAAGGYPRVSVLQADYTNLALPARSGRTAFIGNPPYVRHHNLAPALKAWAQGASAQAGHRISGLAGLHAYFYLATAVIGAPGDVGCFVTSAEWLDVNYGSIVRELLLNGLGGLSIHVLEPSALPFQDVATTAAISCFRLGAQPRSVRLRSVKAAKDIGTLEQGHPVAKARLIEATRWTPFIRAQAKVPEGYVELGELCRVHRGAVTGRNSVWITKGNEDELPEHVLYPSVTRARELFAAGVALTSTNELRRVIDLPADLDVLETDERKAVERFLRKARGEGVPTGYIARTRRAWWSVGLRAAAPILATYMARRPPAFVRNPAGARHVNIAHGLYPRIDLPEAALDRLASALRGSITVAQGRTYAGGLTKFEPKEMERLPVPDVAVLLAP